MVGIAGDREVCMNKISNVVPVRIMADFHAAKEISSDLVAVLLSCSVVISPVNDLYYINFLPWLDSYYTILSQSLHNGCTRSVGMDVIQKSS